MKIKEDCNVTCTKVSILGNSRVWQNCWSLTLFVLKGSWEDRSGIASL